MNKLIYIIATLVVVGCSGGGGGGSSSVMFIGDSLMVGQAGDYSIGYARAVEYLDPPFEVHRIDHNARGTIYQFALAKTMQPNVDTIVMNAMAWDIYNEPTTLAKYEHNLRWVFELYDSYELFFILAPYAREDPEWDVMVDERNDIAMNVCFDYGVKMLDPRVWELGYVDNIHLDNDSYYLIAEQLIGLLINE